MDEFKIRVVPRPWNKGKLVGQKAPLKLKEIWAIRVRLQVFCRTRELALFELGIDSKLRACDLLKLRVRDVCHGERIAARAIVVGLPTAYTRSFPSFLGDVARIIAQRLAHKPLRFPLAGPVEEPEQIVNDGVGMHALGFHIRL